MLLRWSLLTVLAAAHAHDVVADYIQRGLVLRSNQTTAEQTTQAPSNTSTLPMSSTSLTTMTTSLAQGGNGSLDDCYSSYESYWTASRYYFGRNIFPVSLVTVTSVVTATSSAHDAISYSTDYTYTVTVVDGTSTVTTQTVIQPYSYSLPAAPTSTTVVTEVSLSTIYSTAPTGTSPVAPSCTLPGVYQQCQSQYATYLSAQFSIADPPIPAPRCDVTGLYLNYCYRDGCPPAPTVAPCGYSYSAEQDAFLAQAASAYVFQTPPLCSQTSVPESLCDQARSAFIADNPAFVPLISNAQFRSVPIIAISAGSVSALGSAGFEWTWPTTGIMQAGYTNTIPGCTLGCARCSVIGNSVRLLYWPSATATLAPGAVVTATVEDTTLTSPTLYVSFTKVSAANACSTLGPVIDNMIVAIPTDLTLSSVYAGPLRYDAHRFQISAINIYSGTASFNLDDLQTPVPYSVYSQQSWCANAQFGAYGPGGLTCPTDSPYAPTIVLPDQVLASLNPLWSSCSADIRGFYDPPSALQAAASIATPTIPVGSGPTTHSSEPITTHASPGSTPASPNSTPTPPAQSTPANDGGGSQGGGNQSGGNQGGGSQGGGNQGGGSPAQSDQFLTASSQDPGQTVIVVPQPGHTEQNPPNAGTTPSPITTSGSTIIIGGTTVQPGQQITVGGQTISRPPTGNGVVIDGTSTVNLGDGTTAMTVAVSDLVSQGVVTLGSDTVTIYGVAGTAGAIIIDGTIVQNHGPAVTISGATFSEGDNGLVEMSDGQTTTLTGVGVSAPTRAVVTTQTTQPSESQRSSAGGQVAPAATTGAGTKLSSEKNLGAIFVAMLVLLLY